MSLHHPVVAIVGATGAVGGELIGCLESRNFPLDGCACSPPAARRGGRCCSAARASPWRS